MSETVEHQPESNRYALRSDGEVKGSANYTVVGDEIHITHVEIDSALQGQGLAGFLMHETLDYIREESKYRVVPQCSYAVKYMDEHPVYQDLLTRGR